MYLICKLCILHIFEYYERSYVWLKGDWMAPFSFQGMVAFLLVMYFDIRKRLVWYINNIPVLKLNCHYHAVYNTLIAVVHVLRGYNAAFLCHRWILSILILARQVIVKSVDLLFKILFCFRDSQLFCWWSCMGPCLVPNASQHH